MNGTQFGILLIVIGLASSGAPGVALIAGAVYILSDVFFGGVRWP